MVSLLFYRFRLWLVGFAVLVLPVRASRLAVGPLSRDTSIVSNFGLLRNRVYEKIFTPFLLGFSGVFWIAGEKKRPEGNHPHRARGFPRNQNRTERIRCDHKELYQMAGRARNIVRASSCRPCIRPSCSCRRCSFPSCRSRRRSFRPSASRRFRPSPTSRTGP